MTKPCLIVTFYRFVAIPHYQEIRNAVLDLAVRYNLKGTMLLAAEGYNATIAGKPDDIAAFGKELAAQDPVFADLVWRESWHDHAPFGTMKVRLKAEVIRMKREDIDPALSQNTHVSPAEWANLVKRDDVVVLDTRNDYEVAFGTFRRALNPHLDNFHEFPEWVDENLTDKTQPVAMFCTGGIRCEKAAAYMRAQGFEKVYQLQGGILDYFSTTHDADQVWQGNCFVFDDRIAVNPHLSAVATPMCQCTGKPITTEDIKFRPEPFTSCGACLPQSAQGISSSLSF